MLSILFALLAGILPVAAPCTLPVLPVLLGASIGQRSSARPVFMALGFAISFAGAVLVFSAITQIAGVDAATLRSAAIVMLTIFGLLMIWPQPFDALMARLGSLLGSGHRPRTIDPSNVGGFLLGTTLGLVWTPCAGPVLGSILTVLATTPDFSKAALLLCVYALGAAIPMLAIAYGGQVVTTRVKHVAAIAHRLRQGFGVVVIGFAAAMHFQYDTLVTAWLSDLYPNVDLGL
jgi:cytochrome c-type biogenesis protein